MKTASGILSFALASLALLAASAGAQPMDMKHMEHMSHLHHMTMQGMLGPYAMSREASGTSWQPEAAAHLGRHIMHGDWMWMLHADGILAYDEQGGHRGDRKVFASNMLMLMGTRPAGPGRFGLRSMLSLEPITIGKKGYPLLLQTGETADGRTPLIDRQHAHDLFMELALTYALPIGSTSSAFAYVGLPGEPALGPPAFMHRFSALENPEAPISHHWLDSTHISFGVTTLGFVHGRSKLEASAFKGREPDEKRFNIESPKLDSYAFRVSHNPTENWALQASFGHLHSPEQLEPDHDTDRLTASAIYDRSWNSNEWQTTLAWGQNRNDPGRRLDAWLLESALFLADAHTVFARLERVEKDELFQPGQPLADRSFAVGKLALGYTYDVLRLPRLRGGIGAAGTLSFVPKALEPAYGSTPRSGLIFVRVKLQ
jgi:hypothetical protein